jgi:hypothetical protein
LSLKTKVDDLSVVCPQNQWDGLSVVLPQNHWVSFLRFGLRTGGDSFFWFSLKTGGGGFSGLASTPVAIVSCLSLKTKVVEGFPV